MPDSSPSAQQPTPQRTREHADRVRSFLYDCDQRDIAAAGVSAIDALDSLDEVVAAASAVEDVERLREALVDLHESLFIGSERGLSKGTLHKMAAFAKAAALARDGADQSAPEPDDEDEPLCIYCDHGDPCPYHRSGSLSDSKEAAT